MPRRGQRRALGARDGHDGVLVAVARVVGAVLEHDVPRQIGRRERPVVGVVASWLQLGERPSGVEATGMVLIIAALALLAAYGLLGGGVGRASAEGYCLPPIID